MKKGIQSSAFLMNYVLKHNAGPFFAFMNGVSIQATLEFFLFRGSTGGGLEGYSPLVGTRLPPSEDYEYFVRVIKARLDSRLQFMLISKDVSKRLLKCNCLSI